MGDILGSAGSILGGSSSGSASANQTSALQNILNYMGGNKPANNTAAKPSSQGIASLISSLFGGGSAAPTSTTGANQGGFGSAMDIIGNLF